MQIAAEGWESLWDAEQQKQFWLQTSTGEIRARMPALMGGADAKEVARLRDARPMPAFRLRTLVVVGEGEVGSEEYRQFHAEHEAEVDVFRDPKEPYALACQDISRALKPPEQPSLAQPDLSHERLTNWLNSIKHQL